jgi:glycosyltransferase involved in cell wall biosynthesis
MSGRFERVSVIIPARNEAANIARSVRAIAEQGDVADALEIIVVDDGSTDNTAIVARNAGATVIQNGTGGNPGAARNRGAISSRGDPLIFLDADCVVKPGWLIAILNAHADGETIVAGSLALPGGLSATARCDYYCGWYLAHAKRPASYVPHAPAPNLSVRRQAFFSTEGFSERGYHIASEERGWQADLAARGHRIRFVPDACAQHYNRPGLRNLVLRSYRWGFAAIEGKASTGTARMAWLYRYPRTLIVASLPLAFAHATYILWCWLRARCWEPLWMSPLILLSSFAYTVGMSRGGIAWLRQRAR